MYRHLVDRIRTHAIVALDAAGQIISWSAGAEETYGWTEEEALGQHISLCFLPDERKGDLPQRALQAAAEEGHWEDEGWHLRKDGLRFWAHTVLTSRRDSADELIGFADVTHDLTASRRDQAALRILAEASELCASALDYEATLDEIVRLAVPGFAEACITYILDQDGEVCRVEAAHADPAKEEQLCEALGRESLAVNSLSEPVRHTLRSGEAALIPEVTAADAQLRDADGNPETHSPLRLLDARSVMVVPLVARGRTMGAMVLSCTERDWRYEPGDLLVGEKLANLAATAVDNARLFREAQEASEAKSNFLAIMSHELRTPLNAILGYSDLLLAGVPEHIPPASETQVESMRVAAQHLSELIEEILTFARIEAGQEHAQIQMVELSGLVDGVRELVEPLARAKDLTFHAQLQEGLGRVRTDARRLRQILLNLLSNAVKFTDEGEIRLDVARDDDEGELVLSVSDTGTGIAAENLEQIWEPFWQAEQTKTRRASGTGLGLSVVRQLARLLGGEVRVQSTMGRGTTFFVTLPLKEAQDG